MKAAISDTDEAVEKWRQWISNIELSKLEVGSRFLLPMVYQNLIRHQEEIEPRILEYLRKLCLITHGQNVKHFCVLDTLLETFNKAGLQITLLKGAAMTLLYYKKPGLRPMSDLDILIPTAKLNIALDLLLASGWQPRSRAPEYLTRTFFKTVPGYEFFNQDGQLIDLHWHVLHECCDAEADDDFRQGAVSFDYKNFRVSALNPADQLLHACVQGARCEGVAYLRWAIDAVTILRNTGDAIDWRRLVLLAKKHRLILPVRDAFTYLDQRLGIPLPPNILEELYTLPVARIEQFEYQYKRQNYKPKPLGYWPIMWFDYSRQRRNQSAIRKMLGFPKYINNFLGTENLSEFATLLKTIIVKKMKSNPYRS